MSYSTVVMLRNALAPAVGGEWSPELEPDPENPTGTAADLPDAQLLDAIAEADAMIDSFLSGRYTVPIMPVAPLSTIHPVDYWSRDLAAYYATLTYRGSQDFAETDPMARRYNGLMLMLVAVRDGKQNIPFPENTGPSASYGAGKAHNPYTGDLFTPPDFDLYPVPTPDRLFPARRPFWPADGQYW